MNCTVQRNWSSAYRPDTVAEYCRQPPPYKSLLVDTREMHHNHITGKRYINDASVLHKPFYKCDRNNENNFFFLQIQT